MILQYKDMKHGVACVTDICNDGIKFLFEWTQVWIIIGHCVV